MVPKFDYDVGVTLTGAGDVFLGGCASTCRFDDAVEIRVRAPVGFRRPDPDILDIPIYWCDGP